jgi:hypothetical protein
MDRTIFSVTPRLVLAVLAALLVLAGLPPASAQARGHQPPPPARAPRWQQTNDYPTFADIPDLVGYVDFRVPQCDECTPDGERPFVKRDPEPPFPNKRRDWIIEVDTFLGTLPVPNLAGGMTKLLIWLGWKIKDVILDLVCLLLIIFQWLADFFATAINVVLAVLNTVWRFLIFAWLTIRMWVVGFWAFLGEARQFFVYVQQAAMLVWAWLVALGELVLVVLALLGQVVLFVLDTMLALIGVLAWLLGLTVGALAAILAALASEAPPVELDDTHAVYYMVRGVLDAILDSQLAFVVYVLVGYVYLNLLMWIARYFKST